MSSSDGKPRSSAASNLCGGLRCLLWLLGICEGPSLSESCVGLACDANERLLRPSGSVTGSFIIGLGAIAPFSVKGVGDYCNLVKLQQPKDKPEKEKISPDSIDNLF
jgi:hypothetical protein